MTCKSSFVLLIIISSFGLVNPVLTQEEEMQEEERQYRIIDVDGVKVRELLPSSPEDALLNELAKCNIMLEDFNQSGVLAVLETLSASSLDRLADLDVLDEQKGEIKALTESYKREVAALEPSGNEVLDQLAVKKLRVKYAWGIKEVMLPEQLDSLAKKVDPKKRLLSVAVFAFKDLSPAQRNKIIRESEALHSELEAKVREVEALQEKTRKSMMKIYRENLSNEQQVEFERYVEVNRVLKSMNLFDMFHDSDMGAAGPEKKDL